MRSNILVGVKNEMLKDVGGGESSIIQNSLSYMKAKHSLCSVGYTDDL